MVTVRALHALLRELEGRRERILASLRLPAEGLPGSLGASRRRCGTSGCHCQEEGGHLTWTLTYMVDGKKRVDHVPNELLGEIRERVAKGNAYKSAVADLMAINARLLILGRRALRMEEAAAKKRGRR